MKFEFADRERAKRLSERQGYVTIDCSSYSPTHSILSPFSYSKDYEIPVPGQEGMTSRSVEGIWQGLKIINGSIDENFFIKRPKKRSGPVTGHLLSDEVLGIVEARKKIYIPSYFYYLNNYVDEGLYKELLRTQLNGQQVVFYDTETNGDMRIDKPLAHSAILASYMNYWLWELIPEKLKQPPSLHPRNDLSEMI